MMPISKIQNRRIGFKRIICPVDIAHDSDEALRYATALARDYSAKLFLLHCIDDTKVVELSERAKIKSTLEKYISKHNGAQSAEALELNLLLVEGEAEESIVSRAAELSADLIVMRSRRRPKFSALLGSTAEAVSRTAPCPVLVSHPEEQDWVYEAGKSNLKRVLVAYDFSSDAELALSYGLSLAEEYQGELHLLHVLPERQNSEAPELSRLPFSVDVGFQTTAARLNGVIPLEALAWCDLKQAIREGQPYREILNYAEEEKIDLICLGASGTGYGMRTLFGSNADRVLRQSPCPVLIARPLRPIVALKPYVDSNLHSNGMD
jgi:nucleotide-binding universal stress UspA family protein